MFSLTIAFLISLIATGLIVRLGRQGAWALHDDDLAGVHKLHAVPVPRVGGEDLTRQVGIKTRLLATALAAL